MTADERIDAISKALTRRAGGGPAALLLDYDGTLTPIVPDPWRAVLRPSMKAALEAVVAHPSLRVAIITGRDLPGLERVAGELPGVWRAVNGGLRIVAQEDWTHPQAQRARPALRRAAEALEKAAQAAPGAFLEDKGLSLALHWRQCPDQEEALDEAVRRATRDASLRVIRGKAIHEIQPDVAWDKGRAGVELLDRWGISDAALFLGDDTIDEPGFEAVQARGGLGVRVGAASETVAKWRLGSCDEVELLLNRLSRAG